MEWQQSVFPSSDAYRVLPRESLHVTLAFLGHRPRGELEAIAGALRESTAAAEQPRKVAHLPEKGRGETILLVEDEDPVRMLLRRILLNHGYLVLEARDGADGLRRAQEHGGEIHLLLTDMVMPEMTGPELAKRVAAARPNTRILFMTGYTEHEPAGAAVLLHKPFSSSTLLGHVRRLLDGG